MILKNKQILGQYTVVFPIKQGLYAETYRVKDGTGHNFFLKLFNYAKLHRTQFDENGDILELTISKQLSHVNLTSYHDSGELILEGKKLAYIVYNFISGETVAQKTTREQCCSVYDAKQIVLGVLEGLKYLHGLQRPIIHNEITIQNIMLDMEHNNCPRIIDFGYARFLDQGPKSFMKEGLSPFCMAPETFNGIFTMQSDIYSVGVMLYQLLYGMPPYYMDLSDLMDDPIALQEALNTKRKQPLPIPSKDIFELDDQIKNIMAKATSSNVDDRFQTTEEFIRALKGEVTIQYKKDNIPSSKKEQKAVNIKKGNGFADVIGLDELKEKLRADVIDIFNNPEEAKSWGLSLPNGMLLYGPPGCGKTYLAEKFAEEAGWNYLYRHCSDLGTSFIHGAQMNIGAMFKEARENAPTILFLDEVESLITKREMHNTPDTAGEVNEFLVQLNNCGKDNVFVIGATNHPELIDSAALRAGRLELKYYIPLPDKETRKSLFEMYLKRTKTDFGLDYELLAEKTDRYNSREVQQIVEEAGRSARRNKLPYVTMDILLETISKHPINLSVEDVKAFEKIRDDFEGKKSKNDRPRIGFE